MNKKFSTLLTAGLLMAGALFSSASAQALDPFKAFPTGTELADGVKVYLAAEAAGTNGALKSTQIVEDKVYTLAGDATAANATLFTLDAVKEAQGVLTFQLKDEKGHVIALKVDGDAATSADDALAKTFYVAKDATLESATAIRVLNADATKGVQINSGSYAYASANIAIKFFAPAPETITAEILNKNLSGKGFKFAFPNAVSEADVNPFAVQMLAIDMPTYSGMSTYAGADGVTAGTYFAIANDKATALQAAVALQAAEGSTDHTAATLAAFKEATFIALDPNANFGITGLDVATGEGYGFTTVKGGKLADINDNVKKDGKIACVNAVFAVSEEDSQNAPGEYTIKIAAAKVKGDDNEDATNVFVGAYSLTTGGIKTYITTAVANADKLSLAMSSNNTWAKASDLLSATDATIVNISFLGTKPTTEAEAEASLYGEYLVPVYGATNFTAAVAAPKDVDVNAPLSQWVVSAVNGRDFTFTNRETNVTFTTSLYTTEKAGEYLIGAASMTDERGGTNAIATVTGGVTGDLETIANWGGQTIKLTATTVSEGFMALTDAQLEQQAELVFNGTGNLAARELYMMYDADASGTPFFLPTNDETKALTWFFEKAESVQNKIKYAYLKDDAVAQKDSVVATIPSYLMYKKDNNNVKSYFGGVADDADYATVAEKDTEAQRCYFKKNVDGTYALIIAAKAAGTDAVKYKSVVAGDIKKVSVAVADEEFVTTKVLTAADADYSNVTVKFNAFTESLESVARHATLDSEDGSVSMKLNNNGIVEGIIAGEGLTFWLDTADIDQDIPTFFISKGIEESTDRNFLFYAADSLTYWDAASATYKTNEIYYLEGANKTDMKAIFRPATLAGIDTIATTVAGEAVLVAEKEKEDVCLGGVKNFKFYIMKAGETSYYIRSVNGGKYLYNLNGKLGFTADPVKALVVTLGEGDSPVANEDLEASSISVVATNGAVIINGAAGKKVTISNVLGQTIANTVLTSDNATIAAPAGLVIVAVEGEAAVKAIVK